MPTIIIAHGAFMQPSLYKELTLSLNKLGISKTFVPQLPSSAPSPPEDGFIEDVQVLRNTLLEALASGDEILVVAHSYGSMPLTEALTDIPSPAPGGGRIAGIVFIAAMVPASGVSGESLATAMKTGVAPWVRIEDAVCYAENPAAIFFNTCRSSSLVESAVSAINPQTSAAFVTPVTSAAWKNYRCAYVRTLQDKSTSLLDQDHMIEKLKRENALTRVIDVESDHCPFLGMPDELAGIIVDVVKS